MVPDEPETAKEDTKGDPEGAKEDSKGEASAPASKKRKISQITKDLDDHKVEPENSQKSSKKLKLETDPQSSAMVVISRQL